VTMAKGGSPSLLNIWNPWLREGHPNRKTLALQVGGGHEANPPIS